MLYDNSIFSAIKQALKGIFMEKLVLIDGNSLINRAFYAMPLLTTKDGTYTNAVYGFMNMFFKMQSEVNPDYVAVAFDVHAPTFRHKMFTEYKGTRKPMPAELRPQIPLLKKVLTLMGVYIVEKEGSEADDIIGTIAKNTKTQTFIYTGDKDSFQLVDEETSVYFTRRGITDVDVYSAENFTQKTGLYPKQIIDLKSLMGDASDNIPGVAGVGEKTALSLIQKYGSLDGVYENIAEIKGKLAEKLIENKDTAYLSHKLATIDTSCGVSTDVSLMRVPKKFGNKVKKEFIKLEFKSLYKREDLFSVVAEEKGEPEECEIVNIDNTDKIVEYIGGKRYAVVLTADGLNFSDGKKEYAVKFSRDLLGGLSARSVLSAAKPLFGSDKSLILFDKKTCAHTLKELYGLSLDAYCDDASLVKYLVDFTGGGESLTDVFEEYSLNKETPAYSLFALFNELYARLSEEKNIDLYKNVELPLSSILFDMEETGFKVDGEALEKTGEKYREILDGLEKEIREFCGEPELNVNSPKQLGEVLFVKLKLGKGKKTKTGYSTNADVLESLADASPVIPLILRYRKIQKLYSTYVEGFKPLIDKQTGLIHTSFNQTVTATGRLSSKEPNLQNIPVRDDEGRELRKFFASRSADGVLLDADYSQIELRLLAAFSGCKGLMEAFRRGEDVHSSTASKVFGVAIEKVTPKMRREAKAVNFGIIYGISEYGLAKNLGISPFKAKEYIDSYFKQFPEVKEYMDKNVAQAKEKGYAETFMGRRRYIRELSSSNFAMRQFGERVAMNMPLQGSAADIIKVAMINVSDRLKKEKLQSKLILQVHDELIIDAVADEKEQVEKLLKEEMENAAALSVPLTVDVGKGKTWYDAK